MGPPELTVYVTLRKMPNIDIRICLQCRRLPAIKEMWVPSLGQEDPLEKGMATHSSILAWEISWTEDPGGLHSMGSKETGMT